MSKNQAKLAVLKHLLEHPGEIVRHATLKKLAAPFGPKPILRELQRQDGWPLLSGQTALDMIEAGEIPPDSEEYVAWSGIHPPDAILQDTTPDPDAPRRWRLADDMRGNPFRENGSPRTPS